MCVSGSGLVNWGADRNRSNTEAGQNSVTDIPSTRYHERIGTIERAIELTGVYGH